MAARGRTGTIMGLDEQTVTDLLLDWHAEHYDAPFLPSHAREHFVTHDVTPEQADGLVQAYLRIRGVEQQNGDAGLWVAGPNVRTLIAHRDVRLATGQFDVADMRYFADLALTDPPDGVRSLQERCRTMLKQLQGEM